jgi:SAM-dependent methyltransferase
VLPWLLLKSVFINDRGKAMDFDSLLTLHNLKSSAPETAAALEAAAQDDLYAATLRLQNELNSGETLRYLGANSRWTAAQTVLDLGCGTGDLVADLAVHFPDKHYTGVDINADFVLQAGSRTRELGHCEFFQGDLYDFAAGRYDFVILRAVLQHLQDPDRFMKHLPALLRENAAVLFLETTRENFIEAEPPIAAFDRFYEQLEAVQREHTGSRDCIAELLALLPSYPFRLLESHTPRNPVTTEADRLKTVRYLALACATVRKMMPVRIRMEELFADLAAWHDAPRPRLSIKSRRLLIEAVQ